LQALSEKSSNPTFINNIGANSSTITALALRFSPPLSAYVRLLSVKNSEARDFYETQASVRAGPFGIWTGRSAANSIEFLERLCQLFNLCRFDWLLIRLFHVCPAAAMFSLQLCRCPRTSVSMLTVLACTLLKRLCQFGVVVNGGGFAASLDEFSRHGAIYFPMWSGAKAEDNARQTPPESP
jgi:hypothetical protein